MIEATGLTKVYSDTIAVDGIDFQLKPGVVTGFLGPNGGGKSTTMRMILGLDLPSAGKVAVNGQDYQCKVWPLRDVGALLDARAVHPGRSAYNHLHSLAAANGIARKRGSAGRSPGRDVAGKSPGRPGGPQGQPSIVRRASTKANQGGCPIVRQGAVGVT